MEDISLFIDWLMESFIKIYVFFVQTPAVVQAAVFLPIASFVILLFINFVKSLFKGRSI